MFWKIILGLLFLILIVWAVKTKIFLQRRRNEKKLEGPVESPASVALGEIVAVAGGIYLSLVLLATFLKLDLPPKVNIGDLAVDPLALAAIIIALLQPIVLGLYYKWKK